MEQSVFAPVVIVLVPMVVALLKKCIPAGSWLWPVLAAVLGAGADVAHTLVVTGAVAAPWAGVALGLAGVGLREVVDQLARATSAQ